MPFTKSEALYTATLLTFVKRVHEVSPSTAVKRSGESVKVMGVPSFTSCMLWDAKLIVCSKVRAFRSRNEIETLRVGVDTASCGVKEADVRKLLNSPLT